MHAAPERSKAGNRLGGGSFAEELDSRYPPRLRKETLMLNELYLAVLYRPIAGTAPSLLSRLLAKSRQEGKREELADSLDACEKLAQTLAASLTRYEPESWSATGTTARLFVRARYLGLLINGEWQRMPMPRGPLNHVLAECAAVFGTEAIEYRRHRTRVGAMLGIKEYPTPTVVGMFNRLLSAPLPFVLTQSFTFLTKARRRHCCSASSIAWPTPATSPCRKRRNSRMRSMS